MRSRAEIMSVYPRCERCEHRAEDHLGVTCRVTVIGQCASCAKRHVVVKCECQQYVGPTLQQFCEAHLSEEEIRAHFPGPDAERAERIRQEWQRTTDVQ